MDDQHRPQEAGSQAFAAFFFMAFLSGAQGIFRAAVPDVKRLEVVSPSGYILRRRMRSIMPKSAMIRARMEPVLKHRVETVFDAIGLSATEAITLFYRQVLLRNGLPFDVVIPNDRTRRTLRDTDNGRRLVHARDADDLFDKLGRISRRP
jgi:DNA-damage-inducible protein J